MSRAGAETALAGPVIGYRSWQLTDGNLMPLTPHGNFRPWGPAGATAVCETGRPVAGEHHAPHPDCACGLYAWHAPRLSPDGAGRIDGAVIAWGAVEVHEQGFRAAHARPVALVLPPAPAAEDRRALARVAERYRAALVPANLLEAFAREWGAAVPSTLRLPPDPFTQCGGLVARIASEYRGRGLGVVQLLEAGMTGLQEAAARYDPRNGPSPEELAGLCIRCHVVRAVRLASGSSSRIPAHLVEATLLVHRAARRLRRALGHEPSVKQLACACGLSLCEVERVMLFLDADAGGA